MRLGRRLATGTAEHPAAPPEAPAPAAPQTRADTVGVEAPGPRREHAEHAADR